MQSKQILQQHFFKKVSLEIRLKAVQDLSVKDTATLKNDSNIDKKQADSNMNPKLKVDSKVDSKMTPKFDQSKSKFYR